MSVKVPQRQTRTILFYFETKISSATCMNCATFVQNPKSVNLFLADICGTVQLIYQSLLQSWFSGKHATCCSWTAPAALHSHIRVWEGSHLVGKPWISFWAFLSNLMSCPINGQHFFDLQLSGSETFTEMCWWHSTIQNKLFTYWHGIIYWSWYLII